MTQPNQIICRVLGLSTPPAQLSLYSLIGLPHGESDLARIQASLQEAAQKLRSAAAAPGTSADDVALVRKALQRCSATLLSPEQKTRYDAALQKQAPPPPQRELSPEPSAATSSPRGRLESLLPPGDPHRGFDLQAYLNASHEETQPESVQERKAALAALRTGGIGTAAAPRVEAATAQISERGLELRQKLRRRRAIRNAVTVGGLSLVAIGLVAYAAYAFIYSKRGSDIQIADRSIPRATPAPADPSTAGFSAPPDSETKPPTGTPAKTSPAKSPSDDLPELPTVQIDPPSPGETSEEKTGESMSGSGMNGGTDSPAMQTAASNPGDRTEQLIRIGSESFDEAFEKLASGEAITLPSDIINVVERTNNTLIVRQGGKNVTYSREALPADILDAILNLSLDSKNPIDLAARGVFFLRYSADQAYQDAGRKHLAAAASDPRFKTLDESRLKPQ